MTEEQGRVETLRQHKRELFDGMRAYHRSEIDHKAHAIEVLKAMMTAVLTLYAGLAASAATGTAPGWIVTATSLVFLVATGLCNYFIVAATNAKIDADNRRYEEMRVEYLATRKALDLEVSPPPGTTSPTWDTQTQEQRKQSGYSKTKLVLVIYELSILAIALIATLFLLFLAHE